MAVHPRACGEHSFGTQRKEGSIGSSPRLRGTSKGRLGVGLPFRFIPAPAGNMYRTNTGRDFHSVHPRACGEHP